MIRYIEGYNAIWRESSHLLGSVKTNQSQEAFDRAKAKTIENLSKKLQDVHNITFDEFCQQQQDDNEFIEQSLSLSN